MTIATPIYRLHDLGRTSGGGHAVASNLGLAARLHPNVIGSHPESKLTLVPRNWASGKLLRSRRFVLMPQNAWPWSGDVSGVEQRARRSGLRIASEVSLRRAVGVVRLGESIPAVGRVAGPVLGNPLDEGFDVALDKSMGLPGLTHDEPSLVCIGSLTPYRGLSTLFKAYRDYRLAGGSLPLVVAGPGALPRAVSRSVPPGVRVVAQPIPREIVLATLRDAAAAVFPSTVETAPLTLAEANAVSRLVLTSDIPGHSQSLVCGSKFDVGGSSSLAQHLLVAERTWQTIMPPSPASTDQVSRRADARLLWADSLVTQLLRIADQPPQV